MSFNESLAEKFGGLALQGLSWLPVITVKLGLWIGDPGVDLILSGPGSEVSGNDYARVIVGTGDWTSDLAGSFSNASVITFPEATGLWGTVTHIVIFRDTGSGDIPSFSGALNTSEDIDEGAVPKFQIGDLTVTLT